jgi:hypothetical protein
MALKLLGRRLGSRTKHMARATRSSAEVCGPWISGPLAVLLCSEEVLRWPHKLGRKLYFSLSPTCATVPAVGRLHGPSERQEGMYSRYGQDTDGKFTMRYLRVNSIFLLVSSLLLAVNLAGCGGQSENELKLQSQKNTAAIAAFEEAHPGNPKSEIAEMTQNVENAGYIPQAQKRIIIAENTANIEALARQQVAAPK